MTLSPLLDAQSLHVYLESRMTDSGKYYLFLDEIQLISGWEKVINSMRLRSTDIYITGSNATLLSGELSTLLTGRYVLFNVYPLSYREFIEFRDEFGISDSSIISNIQKYLEIGGFPILSTQKFNNDSSKMIIQDINNGIIYRDVVGRYNIRNVELLERVIGFIYDNIGNLVSLRKISDYFKKEKRSSADIETIGNYLEHLRNAFIINRVPRYDIKGKRILESNDKFYLTDHSLQFAVRSWSNDRIPGLLENIVYVEALRRGYTVYVGKVNDVEVDFVAIRNNGLEKVYIQVCLRYSDNEITRNREFTPLLSIKDHHAKYLVSLEDYSETTDEGIRVINLEKFLLMDW